MCCGKIANPLTLMNCNWKAKWEGEEQWTDFRWEWRGKDGGKRKVAYWPYPNSHRFKYQNKKEKQTRRKNTKIGRRWEKDGINRGRPGLMCGNKPLLLAIHTYSKPRDWRPRAFHLFTHSEYTHTHPPDGAFMQSTGKPPGFMRSGGQVPSGTG